MRLARIVGGALSAGAIAGTMFMVAPASAEPARGTAEFCRQLDQEGELEANGFTPGECLNFFGDQGGPESSNFLAGTCGADFFLGLTGTTNKGQCIKVLMTDV